jgi:cobalamin biosynthesis protein CbiD
MWLLELIPAPIRKAALYAAGGLLAIGLTALWLHVHDANIRKEALVGYVHQAELTAANARAAEQKRQAEAAQAALDEYQRKLAVEQADNAAAQQRLEQEISDYEKNIGADSRCVVSERDRNWLLGNTKS